MDENILNILNGTHVPVHLDVDDQSEKAMQTVPVVKRNVCYICCSVLFDDDGRVLLVQEAKPSCYGQWYLPAGRLEQGETLVAGAKREVKEESGLECDLTSLLCVELNGNWMRFTFTGKVTGGHLKTLEDKDSESLQAQYFSQDELPTEIRCNDILKLIALCRGYRHSQAYTCLPTVHPHKHIFNRFIIVARAQLGGPMHCLVASKGGNSHIPCHVGNIAKNTPSSAMVASFLNAACSSRASEFSIQACGVLGVEHRGTGQEEDGLCITHLINLCVADGLGLPAITSKAFSWHLITDPGLQVRLTDGCLNKKIVPIV